MHMRGTFLHELGHACFELADEYVFGAPEPPEPFPNTWSSEEDAGEAARGRGKSAADVRQIYSTSWWKLCDGSCQMNTSWRGHTAFDRPCHDRVVWCVLDVARSGAR
jgi:hypothetical protein